MKDVRWSRRVSMSFLLYLAGMSSVHGFVVQPRNVDFPVLQSSTSLSDTTLTSPGEDEEPDFDDWEEVIVNYDPDQDPMEATWRFVKKPLLSIGSKGAAFSHGNSLRQLLESHTVVKVKVNTRKFDNSLEVAFEELRKLAEESGAPSGIEMLQAREGEKVILFGMPGTRSLIEAGKFPPEATP